MFGASARAARAAWDVVRGCVHALEGALYPKKEEAESRMLLLEVIAFALIAAPPPARPAQAPGIERLTLEEAARRAIPRSTTSLIAEQEIRRPQGILKAGRAPALPIRPATEAATRPHPRP